MNILQKRVLELVNNCWDSFSHKVGSGLIKINKEASMQLQFAYLLKNSIGLILYTPDEQVSIELETTMNVVGKNREIDILIEIEKGKEKSFLPIEMKCYKNKSSSGGLRGAQDLFRLGVYEDIQLLESYSQTKDFLQGIQLTMTDASHFVNPKSKKGKSWAFDISHNYVINDGVIHDVPMGSKRVKIQLKKSYNFNWTQKGDFYFLMIRGN